MEISRRDWLRLSLGTGLAGLAFFAVPLAIVWMALGIWLGYAQRRQAARVPEAATREAA